jgi:hypothetical protein
MIARERHRRRGSLHGSFEKRAYSGRSSVTLEPPPCRCASSRQAGGTGIGPFTPDTRRQRADSAAIDHFRILRYRNKVAAAADVELTRALERGDVPDAGFPHVSHLRVAWVYLSESPTVDQALARMAATLRRFAASVGRPEKYSDAITAFWMYQMAAARAVMPGAAVDDVLRAYPRLLDKALIDSAPRAADSSSDPSDRPVSRRSA